MKRESRGRRGNSDEHGVSGLPADNSTERETERRADVKQGSSRKFPRGIRIFESPGPRPSPYGVSWSVRVWDAAKGATVREVKHQFFPTKELRDARASELAKEKRQGVTLSIGRSETNEWTAFKQAIGDADWRDVVGAWLAHRQAHKLTQSDVTVGERVETHLKRLEKLVERSELAVDSYRQRKHKLQLFAERLGPNRIGAVDTEHVRTWLDSMPLNEAGTYNNYRKIVYGFFEEAKIDRLIHENPVERIKPRREIAKPVGILSPQQVAQLMWYAMTHDRYKVCLWRLSLEVFAGIRFGSALRLERGDVKVADKGIVHPAASIKTTKRQYVEGFPENLWKWLAVAPDDSDLSTRQYLQRKSELFIAANVPHPHNCLRHTFPTMHLAAYSNPGLTALLLCHRSQQKLWSNYKGNATKAEGLLFMAITPESAGQIRQSVPDSLVEVREALTESTPSPDQPGSVPVLGGG